MSENTACLKLPFIAAAQAQKHVTHNEALLKLDALVQLAVRDRDLSAPPADPAEGDAWIVAAPAGGEWSGREGRIAVFQDGAWAFLAPRAGWRAWAADENALLIFDGAQWSPVGSVRSLNPADGGMLGVNASADDANRLAVKSDAVLFSHDDASGAGSGDMRAKLNKAAPGNTASIIFQTNWSGRAEIGLTGGDDLHVKVSADGSVWKEAMVIDRATGAAIFPSGGVREALRADRAYHVDPDTGSDSNDGLSAASALKTVDEALRRCYRIDSNGHGVTIRLADGVYSGFTVDRRIVGSARLEIVGSASAPGGVVIQSSGWHVVKIMRQANVALRHMRFENTGSGSLVYVAGQSSLLIDDVIFGDANRHHMEIKEGSLLVVGGDYEIAGSAVSHVNLATSSIFRIYGRTVDVTGEPHFSTAFACLTQCSSYLKWNSSWSGSATGKRYDIRYNSTCNGGAADHFPGDAAGTTSSGGRYGY